MIKTRSLRVIAEDYLTGMDFYKLAEKALQGIVPEREEMQAVLNASDEDIPQLGFFDLLTKSFDMTQDRLTELSIDIYKPDIVVNICRDSCGVFEFYRANEIIESGRKAFREALDQNSAANIKIG